MPDNLDVNPAKIFRDNFQHTNKRAIKISDCKNEQFTQLTGCFAWHLLTQLA